ncbi:MAG: hypothetical protein LBI70_00440 [Rickettsiales bacterium]|jgi:hypothetical protein|nr:hypothetical protein [Rickettsiales bacterium]
MKINVVLKKFKRFVAPLLYCSLLLNSGCLPMDRDVKKTDNPEDIVKDKVKNINFNEGKEIEVVLYDDPDGVNAFSTPYEVDPGDKTVHRVIGINLAKVKTEKDLLLALFHESYDPVRRSKNERLAEDYTSHAKMILDIRMYGRDNRSLDILDKTDTTKANRRARELIRTGEAQFFMGQKTAITDAEVAELGLETSKSTSIMAVGFGVYVAYQGGRIVKQWVDEDSEDEKKKTPQQPGATTTSATPSSKSRKSDGKDAINAMAEKKKKEKELKWLKKKLGEKPNE